MNLKIKKITVASIIFVLLLGTILVLQRKETLASCTVSVNGSPVASTFANGKVYVTRSATKQVSSFDATTDSLSSTLSTSDSPFSLSTASRSRNNLLTGDKMFIWMNSAVYDGFLVIDTSTDTILHTATSTTYNNAYDGAVSTNGKYYQIMRASSNNLAVINTSTYAQVGLKTVGGSPESIILNDTRNELYTISSGSPGKVTFVDTTTDTVLSTITVGNLTAGVSNGIVAGDYLYVLNSATNTVSIIDLDTRSVVATTTVGTNPRYSAKAGNKIFIGNYNGGSSPSVSVIDQDASFSAVASTISLSGALQYMLPVASGSKIYISEGTSGFVSIDASTLAVTSITGTASITSGVETDNNKFYGISSASGIVDIIDTTTDTRLSSCGATPGTDLTAPTLTSFTSATSNGNYNEGDSINITATFNENLGAGSTMTVVLNTGASVVLSTVSGSTLTGTYTVASGQNTLDLTVSSISSASIIDTHSNTDTTYTLPTSPNNIADTSNIIVDTSSPTGFSISIDPISSTPSDFTDPVVAFSAVDNISSTLTYAVSINGGSFSATTTSPYSVTGIDINFTNSATVMACDETGNCSTSVVYFYPAIIIDAPTTESRVDITDTEITIVEPTGSAYNLSSVSATLDGDPITISCSPTVGVGVKTTTCTIPDGIEAPSDHSNDGTHTLVVSATNSNGVLGRGSQSYLIDTTAPTITSITTPDDDGTYLLGESIDIVLSLSEPVVLGSSVTATFDTGHTLVFTCASATCSTLTATYTVGAGESTSDLSVASFSSSSLEDALGNINSSPSIPTSNNLNDFQDIVIDTEAPSTPDAPDLTSATDTGSSSTDNITYENEIELVGSCTSGNTVEIYKDGSLLSSTTCFSSAYSFTDTLTAYDTYSYKVKEIDTYNNASGFSAILDVVYEEESVIVSPSTSNTVSGSRSKTVIKNTDNNLNQNDNPKTCEPYLTKFIKLGAQNDSTEVKKLATFLNQFENASLKVDGIYDQLDFEAVKAFQLKYKETLDFWGINYPTGYVYISTQKAINRIYCENQNKISCPYFTEFTKKGDVKLEVEKIKRFLNNNEGTNLTVSNIYDDALLIEVKNFQNKYKDKVLDPWGMKTSSGIWYQSTRKRANDIVGCFAPQRLDNGVILE